ncbi:MAG: DUF4124 domain-containing protein [Steroidobacteraceae bacterium]
MTTRILIATAATLVFAASLAQADVWRWKDHKGNWHYSDVPVDGAQLIKSTAPTPIATAAESGAQSDNSTPAADSFAARNAAISDQLDADATARQVQEDLRKKRAEQCKDATERYERSIAARRLYREDKDGQRVYLSEAELAQARIDARAERDSVCGPR